jgi:hypothetical protein
MALLQLRHRLRVPEPVKMQLSSIHPQIPLAGSHVRKLEMQEHAVVFNKPDASNEAPQYTQLILGSSA